MAGYNHSSCVSSATANCLDELLGDDFYDEEVNERACTSSGVALACALPSETRGNTCARSRPTNSHDHCKKTKKSKSDRKIISEADHQNDLSAGSSADPRCSKKRRMFKNGREMSNVGSVPWTDADDDFADAKYRIPLAQRIGGACEDSVIGTSGQALPTNSQHVETSDKAPSHNEVALCQLGAKMPSTSRIVKRPHVPTVNVSASDDHFDVFEFFNNPSTVEHRTKLGHGETSSCTAYRKQKSTEINHKSTEEYATGKLSSCSIASAMKNAPNAGSTDREMQSASHVPTGMWNDPVDDILIGNMVQYSTESKETELTSSSNGRVGSCALGDGNTKHRRFRLKRQRTDDDDCLNKTFDMLDACNETVTQASHLPASSTAAFTDSTFALPRPKSVSTTRLRREICSETRRPSHNAAVYTGTSSSGNACVSDIDVAHRADVTGSGLRNVQCHEDYQDETAVTGSLSAAGTSVSAAFSSSDVRADPYCRKKPRLCHTDSSALDRGGGSSVFHEAKVKRNVSKSRSSAGSVFNPLEDAKNGESHGTGSGCQQSAVVKSSRQNSLVTDRTSVQDTSGSYHTGRKSRHGSNSRDAADGHRHTTAARNDGHLKRTLSRGRAVIGDADDATNLADTNASCATESADSSTDDVIIIGSDSEETVPAECGSEQAGNSSRRPQGSNVESSVAVDGNSGTSLLGRRSKRTARISCGYRGGG